MISARAANRAVAELALLPYFPRDDDARIALVRLLVAMVKHPPKAGETREDADFEDDEALTWLVDRAMKLWSRWEGPRELRAIYCSRFPPGDGVEAGSAIYLDGVPEDPLLVKPRLGLEAGAQAWPAEELEAIGKAWAQRNRISPAEKRRQAMREWMDTLWTDIVTLDRIYDDALIGIVHFANSRMRGYAVYDPDSLAEVLMEREGLSAALAEETMARIDSEVLFFYAPPTDGRRLRPSATPPITQQEVERAVTVVRARREGWTPERVAEIQAKAAKAARKESDERTGS